MFNTQHGNTLQEQLMFRNTGGLHKVVQFSPGDSSTVLWITEKVTHLEPTHTVWYQGYTLWEKNENELFFFLRLFPNTVDRYCGARLT